MDLYHWQAQYSDGSVLDEYDEEHPTGRGFHMIDQSRLAHFILIPQVDGLMHHVLKVTDDVRPIFFRRRFIETNADGEEQGRATVHCLGLQTTANGKNVPYYTFYFQDGSTLISSDHQAI